MSRLLLHGQLIDVKARKEPLFLTGQAARSTLAGMRDFQMLCDV